MNYLTNRNNFSSFVGEAPINYSEEDAEETDEIQRLLLTEDIGTGINISGTPLGVNYTDLPTKSYYQDGDDGQLGSVDWPSSVVPPLSRLPSISSIPHTLSNMSFPFAAEFLTTTMSRPPSDAALVPPDLQDHKPAETHKIELLHPMIQSNPPTYALHTIEENSLGEEGIHLTRKNSKRSQETITAVDAADRNRKVSPTWSSFPIYSDNAKSVGGITRSEGIAADRLSTKSLTEHRIHQNRTYSIDQEVYYDPSGNTPSTLNMLSGHIRIPAPPPLPLLNINETKRRRMSEEGQDLQPIASTINHPPSCPLIATNPLTAAPAAVNVSTLRPPITPLASLNISGTTHISPPACLIMNSLPYTNLDHTLTTSISTTALSDTLYPTKNNLPFTSVSHDSFFQPVHSLSPPYPPPPTPANHTNPSIPTNQIHCSTQSSGNMNHGNNSGVLIEKNNDPSLKVMVPNGCDSGPCSSKSGGENGKKKRNGRKQSNNNGNNNKTKGTAMMSFDDYMDFVANHYPLPTADNTTANTSIHSPHEPVTATTNQNNLVSDNLIEQINVKVERGNTPQPLTIAATLPTPIITDGTKNNKNILETIGIESFNVTAIPAKRGRSESIQFPISPPKEVDFGSYFHTGKLPSISNAAAPPFSSSNSFDASQYLQLATNNAKRKHSNSITSTGSGSNSIITRTWQTPEKRQQRLQRDAERHREYYKRETEEQRLARRLKDAQRHREAYARRKQQQHQQHHPPTSSNNIIPNTDQDNPPTLDMPIGNDTEQKEENSTQSPHPTISPLTKIFNKSALNNILTTVPEFHHSHITPISTDITFSPPKPSINEP